MALLRPFIRLGGPFLTGLLCYLGVSTSAFAQNGLQVDHAEDQTIYFVNPQSPAAPVTPQTPVVTGPLATPGPARSTPAGQAPPLLPQPTPTNITAGPKPLKTSLFDLKYLGPLHPSDDSTPYFLFAGNPCDGCSSERALYLIRPNGNAAPKVTSFVYPGKVFDPKSRALVMESRAFFGRCLAGQGYVYVVFQQEHHVDHRHPNLTSVFVAEAHPDFPHERLIDHGMPSISRTLKLVKAKSCTEIAGRNRMYEIKPRGLNWRNIQPDSDDDDDDHDARDSSDSDSPPAQD